MIDAFISRKLKPNSVSDARDTNILFNEEYSKYLVRLNDLIATRDLYIKVFNKTKRVTYNYESEPYEGT